VARLVTRLASVAVEPDNAVRQRDLGIAYNRLGDVQRLQGDLTAAEQSYHIAFESAQRLAARDPGNAQWQRDLSVSHNKLGDIMVELDDLAGAEQSF
ncbi:MAG: hypothetical protein AB8B85_15190, partial [Paracoccaceae bacterium]